jgi:hypothetical protein
MKAAAAAPSDGRSSAMSKDDEAKVVHVETKETPNDPLNTDEATVTLDNGGSATSRSIGKDNAITGAANKAKRSWL